MSESSDGDRRRFDRGLASIIIPCWNQVEFTRLCLDALFRHTRRPWELIVVDNGSTDGTAEFLAGIPAGGRVSVPVSVTVIRNERNRGFPAAVNQGLRAARGKYLVLLNNDAVVTEGWLDHLVALAAVVVEGEAGEDDGRFLTAKNAKGGGGVAEAVASRRIGLVGPMSNYATPPQLVQGVTYRNLDEMHAFAARWSAEQRGKWFTTGKLSGFCLLMTRAVFDAIGGLDERFGLGFFDDDDLAERARRAGFALGVAVDVFVHHFGSRTFVGNGVDAGRVLEENARRFAGKWGTDVVGQRVALKPWTPEFHAETQSRPDLSVLTHGPEFHAETQRDAETQRGSGVGGRSPLGFASARVEAMGASRAARVSLTMIVRDEEKNLASCLESVRGIFDEIIVVDTGSVDRTVEIARSFGARVFDFVWVDDFAAARNAALARATGDYAFWLDADDVVEPAEREKLAALLAGLDSPAAYVVRCACDPGEDGSGGETVVDHIRLFPLGQAIRWTYRVHEQILPAVRRAGVPVKWSGVTVRHTGYSNRAVRARKLARDSRILAGELEERPGDPFVLFNLGAIAIERQAWREALEYLRRSLAGSAPGDSITRKLYALIARSHQMLGEPGEALAACRAGLEVDPDDAELMFREAVVRRQTGDAEGARKCWERILTLSRPEKFASVDQGIYGHLTRRNLAALAAERGDHEEEERLWRAVLDECPGDREAASRLRGPDLTAKYAKL